MGRGIGKFPKGTAPEIVTKLYAILLENSPFLVDNKMIFNKIATFLKRSGKYAS